MLTSTFLSQAEPLAAGLAANIDWRQVSDPASGEPVIEPLSERARAAFHNLRVVVALAMGGSAAPPDRIDRDLVARLHDSLVNLKAIESVTSCAMVAVISIAADGYPNSLRIVARKAEDYAVCLNDALAAAASATVIRTSFEPSASTTVTPVETVTRTSPPAATSPAPAQQAPAGIRAHVVAGILGAVVGSALTTVAFLVRGERAKDR